MKDLQYRIAVGRGKKPADLVLKNTQTLDVFSGTWVKGDIAVVDGMIAGIGETYSGKEEFDCQSKFVVPGFIDAHIHIESTMMLPQEFAKAVLPHGTTSIIWDPHEIANVLGITGLKWALESAEKCPVDLFVMLSSCVPSSKFETAGAKISAKELAKLKSHPKTLGLAEMMDFPSVLDGKKEVLEKLMAFQDRPMDGHSPLLRGKDLNGYIAAGIRTCHEVCSLEEAREKLSRGMRVMVREGSVAKNARDLVPILSDYSGMHCMVCTDDRNPLDISEEGHLDYILRIAMQEGKSPEIAYRSASLAPALFYGMHDRGAVAPGYIADLVVLENLREVKISKVFKRGMDTSSKKWKWPKGAAVPKKNTLNVKKADLKSLIVRGPKNATLVKVNAIEVIPQQIITGHKILDLPIENGIVQSTREVQKMAVFERHHGTGNIGISYVTGFNLKFGAIASTVAHDAHNIGIVGASDEAIMAALAAVKKMGGGIVCIGEDLKVTASLPLPVAGLMSQDSFTDLIPQIKALRAAVKALGCDLNEPFLQMSFLALPVIPSLKISDLGLIDVENQRVLPILA